MPGTSRNINFFSFVRAETRIGKRTAPLALLCFIALSLVILFWLLFTFLKINADNAQTRLAATETGDSPDFVKSNQLTDIIRIFNDEKVPVTEAFETIFASQPGDLEILAATYLKGVIKLECRSERELCGADFAASLRATGDFADVTYRGVTVESTGYRFEIAVTLYGNGGDAGETDETGK